MTPENRRSYDSEILRTYNEPVAPPPEMLPADEFGRFVGLREETVWGLANNSALKGTETRDGVLLVPASEIDSFRSDYLKPRKADPGIVRADA